MAEGSSAFPLGPGQGSPVPGAASAHVCGKASIEPVPTVVMFVGALAAWLANQLTPTTKLILCLFPQSWARLNMRCSNTSSISISNTSNINMSINNSSSISNTKNSNYQTSMAIWNKHDPHIIVPSYNIKFGLQLQHHWPLKFMKFSKQYLIWKLEKQHQLPPWFWNTDTSYSPLQQEPNTVVSS